MVVRVNIQNYSDEVKMQTTRLLKMLQLKCSCWSFLLFLLLSLFKKKKKEIIPFPIQCHSELLGAVYLFIFFALTT